MQRHDGELFDPVELVGEIVTLAAGLRQNVPDFLEFIGAVGDGFDKAFHLGDRVAVTLLQAVAFARQFLRPTRVFMVILAHIDFDQRGIEHLALEPGQHAPFQLPGRDDAVVVTGVVSAFTTTRTAPAVGTDDRIGPAAIAAPGDARQHVLWPASPWAGPGLNLPQHGLHRFP